MANVIKNGDTAIGHTDIQGSAVTGTVTSNTKTKIAGISVAKAGDNVFFPSHPHALDIYGSPINYRSHNIPVTGTGKLTSEAKKVALHGEVVNVADEAGGNATFVGTQSKLTSA